VRAEVLFGDLHESAVRGAAAGVLRALFLVEVLLAKEGTWAQDGHVHHLAGGEPRYL
jgi:hypothetical protein